MLKGFRHKHPKINYDAGKYNELLENQLKEYVGVPINTEKVVFEDQTTTSPYTFFTTEHYVWVEDNKLMFFQAIEYTNEGYLHLEHDQKKVLNISNIEYFDSHKLAFTGMRTRYKPN